MREAGVIFASLVAAGAFVLPSARGRALSLLAALALVPVLLLGDLWDSAQLEPLRDRPGLAAGAAVAGLGAVGLLALLILRRPAALPLLVVGTLPFRVPVEAGGDTANLLVPLYLVIAAGGVAYAWRRLRGAQDDRSPGPLELALLAAVLLYAVQGVYSDDFDQAFENLVFFYLPFALLLKLLIEVDWSARLVAACLGLAASLALVFVAIGFWEYATRHLLWNPKVVASNQFESYFRVNSLFFDPSIYGRFLALVMVGLAAVLLWAREQRTALVLAGVLGVLWAGLVLTFSQSSFAALLVGLAVLAALRWGSGRVIAVTAAVAVAGAALALAAPGALDVDLGSERTLDNATSGRVSLMRGGVEMFAARPLGGFGSGSFADVFREREEVSSREAATASHTIPITVAAEQGVPGLVAYLAILAAAASVLFAGLGALRPIRHRRPRPGDDDPPPTALVARAGVAAALAALVLHTLLYAAFLEDPLTWTLAGIALGLAVPAASPRTRTGSSSR